MEETFSTPSSCPTKKGFHALSHTSSIPYLSATLKELPIIPGTWLICQHPTNGLGSRNSFQVSATSVYFICTETGQRNTATPALLTLRRLLRYLHILKKYTCGDCSSTPAAVWDRLFFYKAVPSSQLQMLGSSHFSFDATETSNGIKLVNIKSFSRKNPENEKRKAASPSLLLRHITR